MSAVQKDATVTSNLHRQPSGIPPLSDCPSWCTDPGHASETGRVDQKCYSDDLHIESSLHEVEMSRSGAFVSRIAAMAYRRFNERPTVLLHIAGFAGRLHDGLDEELTLTADEARRLARFLSDAADHVDPPTDGGNLPPSERNRTGTRRV